MKNLSIVSAIAAALLVQTLAALAQQGPAPPPGTAPVLNLPVVPPSPPLPLIDPAKELKGALLVEALRKGGFVLYMRHAETGVVTEKCDQSNLSATGEVQARAVGAAVRELNIPVGMVRASQPCRTGDSARLLGLGKVEITEDLNPVPPRPGFDIGAARARRLAEKPAAETNTVLVSHLHGSANKEEWLQLEMAEIIVFRPDGNGHTEPVARIRAAGWSALREAAVNNAARP